MHWMMLRPEHQEPVAALVLSNTKDKRMYRHVLAITLALSDSGEEPVPLFKIAALKVLRYVVKTGKVPPCTDKRINDDAVELQMAVDWWKLKENEPYHRKISTVIANMHHCELPRVTRALKSYGGSGRGVGGVARGQALFELGHGEADVNGVFLARWWQWYHDRVSEWRKSVDGEFSGTLTPPSFPVMTLEVERSPS